jgi:hypothetical protein
MQVLESDQYERFYLQMRLGGLLKKAGEFSILSDTMLLSSMQL